MKRNVTLIGYGAIGRAVCAALQASGDIAIKQVLVRTAQKDRVAAVLPNGISAITSLDTLNPDTDFVLECAGHEAVRLFGPECLHGGVNFGLVSVGALADPDLLTSLRKATENTKTQMVIIPGAIGGIDALSAVGNALDAVTYIARKPPMSWSGSPAEDTHDLKAIDMPTVLFQGTAREAARAYPKNANVVATVALAGVGFDETMVTLMADPDASGNSHQITATGQSFDLDYTTKGAALSENPKTSALTALSALRTLRHRSHGIQI